jgi:glycosyltransferase involved in cell wall biosynthesis
MSPSRIRVIVPCYNSDTTIEKCIISILNSEGVEFELYVIDDGNNKILTSIEKEYPINVIKTSGQEGAGRSRNIGTYNFEGQVVVFIDSDVQIHSDTISSLIKPINDSLAEATVGSYSSPSSNNFYDKYKHLYLTHRYNTSGTYLNNSFWSAVSAVDFETFKNINGFKECFAGAGPEDIDLGIELSVHGARILSVPYAQGVHLSEFSFNKLLKNDIRKGSEDIYIHWTRKVPIMNNRHVSGSDIFSVFAACCVPLFLLFQNLIGFIPLGLSALFYLIVRIRYLKKVFDGEDFLFLVKSFFMTYLLDIIRGYSVVKGTSLVILEIISEGRYKPFSRVIN